MRLPCLQRATQIYSHIVAYIWTSGLEIPVKSIMFPSSHSGSLTILNMHLPSPNTRSQQILHAAFKCVSLFFATLKVMKNIFHHSFNAYKTDIEPRLNDVTLHSMQCSRRLFEIQLSHRRASAAYVEGDNVAVTVEGEAAYVLNFDTGKQMEHLRLYARISASRRSDCALFLCFQSIQSPGSRYQNMSWEKMQQKTWGQNESSF